jgi:hypothetical protein
VYKFLAVRSSLADEVARAPRLFRQPSSSPNTHRKLPILQSLLESRHRIRRHNMCSTFLPLLSHHHTHVDVRLLRYPNCFAFRRCRSRPLALPHVYSRQLNVMSKARLDRAQHSISNAPRSLMVHELRGHSVRGLIEIDNIVC